MVHVWSLRISSSVLLFDESETPSFLDVVGRTGFVDESKNTVVLRESLVTGIVDPRRCRNSSLVLVSKGMF